MHISKEEDDVSSLIKTRNPYSGKAALQETMVQTGLVSVVPLRTKTVHSNDPPWINPNLKGIRLRQQGACTKGNDQCFANLRNRVNCYRVRKICWGKSQSYESKTDNLKECKPLAWWRELKQLSGLTSTVPDRPAH